MNVAVEKFASATTPLAPANPLFLGAGPKVESGRLVVVRALSENPAYPDLELTTGEVAPIRRGDIIAGILGSRRALRGFVGEAPAHVSAGDRLHILNLGGVIGRFIGGHRDLSMPVEVEVLGVSERNLREAAIPPVASLDRSPTIILVAGSCMNVGKTATTEELIRRLAARGLRVGGAKITGVACLKDTRRMRAAGARHTLSFLDCGFPSTVDAADITTIARSIIARLAPGVDVIVMELGDGVVGHYKVERFFQDRDLMSHIDAVVFCASDLTAAWGGKMFLGELGVKITAICGAATDNESGVDWLETTLGIPSANALVQPEKLLDILSPVFA